MAEDFPQFIDISQKGIKVDISRAETQEDAAQRRKQDMVLFVVAVAFVAVVATGCLWLIFLSDRPDDQKRWAMEILTAIASGFVGYLVGKKA
jgi:hypothetical protein